MTLAVSIRHRLGDFALDVSFESHGRLTALFGASGSGKSSVINIIAGLIRPDFGKVSIGGLVLTDTAKGLVIPVHRRRAGYVFQDARLFPHLSVRQNLAYGEWFTPRAERYASAKRIVELLDIAPILERKPRQLSGGENQRVAIGRALLQSPKILLMDEPLASLDQTRKLEILPYIERLRDETRIPIVYVSHSVAEVSRLATDMVVLADGKVLASGPARDIVQRLGLLSPGDHHEAGSFLEMSVISFDAGLDLTTLRSAAGEAKVPGPVAPAGTAVRLFIRARDVMVATQAPIGLSALNIFPGIISEILSQGKSAANVRIDCGGGAIVALITHQSCVALGLAPGQKVFAVVKSVSVETPGPAPAPATALTPAVPPRPRSPR